MARHVAWCMLTSGESHQFDDFTVIAGEEFDKVFIFGDIRHIQKLNDWTEKQISGFEVNLTDFSDLEEQTYMVMNMVGFGFEEDGSRLKVINIHDKYPQIFDWLNLQDMNVLIILILILVVAGFNMVSDY